jgi:hypothetical protein
MGHVIHFCEPSGVRLVIKNLVVNKTVQAIHTSLMRSMIITKLGEKLSFARLFEKPSAVDLVDSMMSASKDSAFAAHSNLISELNRSILGVLILSKLKERHETDIVGLRLKINELVKRSEPPI